MLGLQRFVGNFATQLLRRSGYSTKMRSATPTTLQGSETLEADTFEEAASKKPKNRIVAAAFESLKNDSQKSGSTEMHILEASALRKNNSGNLYERIVRATTVNGLLSVLDSDVPISRDYALKIVAILAEWSTMNRAKLSDFENDPRFMRVCRILVHTGSVKNSVTTQSSLRSNRTDNGLRTDDLNTVLGVAGDDEAAKLIATISLPQMVRVISALALRKRRSTPLLRSLAFNISSSTEKLDLKQCADVLFAMATLNFKDSVLAAKVCSDIQSGLCKNVGKSAVVGSILTSLGILKYRDLEILESLTEWIIKHSDTCRPQDLSAVFLTSAMLNFKSIRIDEVRKNLVPSIVKEDFHKPVHWVNHVLALAMLRLADNTHLESVLREDFVKAIEEDKDNLSPTLKMKLLNLNSFARLLATNYKGPIIPSDSPVFHVSIAHGKSKQILINGMIDALKSLLPTSNHIKSLVDSKMGFLIDALVIFDANRNPLPLDKEHSAASRVALMVVDFHDVCQGAQRAACGLTNLSFDLLEEEGYKVLPVPYNEFNTSDKLLKRVQYLGGKFKLILHNK